ncbi:MAG: amino acid racemase [Anderseniella sp.]
MSIDGHTVIGIIGGMGPQATVDLMQRIVAATPAHDDCDHLHIIADNNAKVPSRIAALVDGRSDVKPGPVIAGMALRLESAGADAIVMACNSAHWYADDVRAAVSIPFIDMIELACDEAAAQAGTFRRVGVLASTAVHNTGLYKRALEARSMICVLPQDQDGLLDLIKAVKRGDTKPEICAAYAAIAQQLASDDVDMILVACTELSVLADTLEMKIPLIDAFDVLTGAIVAFDRIKI